MLFPAPRHKARKNKGDVETVNVHSEFLQLREKQWMKKINSKIVQFIYDFFFPQCDMGGGGKQFGENLFILFF